MFSGNKKYIWIFAGMFTLVVVVQYLLPKPVNWQRTYSRSDKNPLGTYAIHELLVPAFASRTEVNKSTLYNLDKDNKSKYTLLLINNRVKLSRTDIKNLLNFVNEGNQVLLAANEFDGLLADTFHLKTYSKSYSYFMEPDSLLSKKGVTLRLCSGNQKGKAYEYPVLCFDSYFENLDSTRFICHSEMSDGSPVLISTEIGKGRLYLMSMPDVFTNYFVVNQKNRYYPYAILSLLSKGSGTLIWDEYYKTYNVNKDTFLKFIFASDALYYAYLLTLFSIIVYMIFDGRRRQKAIPIIEPLPNSTLEFVDVVSHVYFNSKNHKFIIDERVRYFYETIRSRFQVSTENINDQFMLHIEQLSGCELGQVKRLFSYCERLKGSTFVQEFDLIELNRQITNFNNKSLR